MEENVKLTLTERQAKDIQFALYYTKYLNHGATNHHLLSTLSYLAEFVGIGLSYYAEYIEPEKAHLEIEVVC